MVLLAGAAATGFGALYVTGLLASGDDAVLAGTRVHGVDIGGLSRSQAQERLDQQLGKTWPEPVKVRIGDRTATIDARAAGFSLDSAQTVAHATRAGADPLTVIGRLFTGGDRDIEPVIRADEAKARAVLTKTATQYDSTPRNGTVTFEQGKPVPVEPRDRHSLDVRGAAEALNSAVLSRQAGPVALPVVRRSESPVDAAEVNRAMTQFARPAMSAPVTVTVAGRQIPISPVTVGKHLTMKPDKNNRLIPELDGKALLQDPAVARPLAPVTGKVAEAKLRPVGDRVVVSDGKTGREVTAKGIEQAVLPLLTRTGAARTAALAAKETQPKVTGDRLRALGIKEKMSTFTVNFERAPYRTTNVGRAAELINGSVVLPGETWSLNRTVGERTKANGFVDGIIIQNDQYTKASGGGVSTVATTVFNALFFAGVKPLEHGAHSFYIERYPEGREATVVWGSLDLKFNNDSGNAIYIQASATDTSVTVSFFGTKKYDSVEAVTGPRTNVKQPGSRPGAAKNCLPQTPLEGFDVNVDRVFRSGGKEAKRETFKTHYVPRDEVTCGPKTSD
ncbi:hypothetical protein FCH28_13780 [Streptomyces piniterrae]|uniref:YoaR-like putative peptidoglycan binding domain-containing protein n=1 Tax=Streptomyces piniterrae TaxID=2571125 RepID=A0A4U0NKA3_9ACTN|nr:VanW family protein [Streptomyces piniterrae]TJZ54660.1 hypothetical protein FCH28_13780 [Streptomyces piniterrae]